MKKKTKAVKVKPVYSIKVKVNGKEYIAEADSLETALLRLPEIKPKTTAVVVVSKEDSVSRPMPLNIQALNRLLAPGTTGQVNRIAFTKRYAFFA